MYYVKWDPEINGVLLNDVETDLTPPRPVFFEELDLLGFNNSWDYPKSKNPLLWAIGRRYFYKGELVAKVENGDALNFPKVIIEDDFKNLNLEEIDIEKVIERNNDYLFVIENNAIDFIENVLDKYPENPVSVSFSGGKDSQSVLDLITRVIHSDDITVIFSDTTLEHEATYETVEETIKQYKENFPGIKFEIAKPIKSANELFKDMGLPSRFHRWCTPILKTAPYNNLINKLIDSKSKIIVFEGVRAEESSKRAKYKQIADSVTHASVINARPILYWNITEVYLYNYYRDLPLNPLYRYGLSRVGCEICPYSSEWSECIHAHIGERFKTTYIPLIKEYAKNRGLSNEKELNEFVSKGQWKKRAGGKGIQSDSTVNFSQNLKNFKSVSINPNSNFLEWIKILGELSYELKDDKIIGELNIDSQSCLFSITKKENKEIIEFENIQGDIKLQSKIKKILKKSTYCVQCGVCDAECLENALKTSPIISINSNSCIHCENCINFISEGCYRAKSIYESIGGNNMSKKVTSGIDRYSTFGLREQWLEEFLEFGEEWLENNSLGPKQIPAITHWLSEANLIDSNTKKATELTENLKTIYGEDPNFVWGIIWINLYYNSKIIKWYCDNVEWGSTNTKNGLIEQLMEDSGLSKGTVNNAVSAMINTFDNSPLNEAFELGNLTKKGRSVKSIDKDGDSDNLDMWLVAYSLYKLKESNSRTDFTVSELYDENFEGGPYKLFGISQTQIERILRGLQQSENDIIKVDLAADLDNIFLKDDISAEDIVKYKKGEV